MIKTPKKSRIEKTTGANALENLIKGAAFAAPKVSRKRVKPKKRRVKPEKQPKKLKSYSDRAKKMQQEGKKLIDQYRMQGFKSYKEKNIDKLLPDEMTKEEYEDFKQTYNKAAIKKSLRLYVDRIKDTENTDGFALPDEDIATDLTVDILKNKQKLAKFVNERITQKVPVTSYDKETGKSKNIMHHIGTELEADFIDDIVRAITGKAPAPGMSNEYFDIDDNYDPNHKSQIWEHIKFKELPTDNKKIENTIIDNLAELAYGNRRLFDKMIERRRERAEDDIIKRLGITESEFAQFNETLNTSWLWYVAEQLYPPSEAVEEAFDNLMKLTNEAQKGAQDDFNKVVTMIKNGEDYYTIVESLNKIIEDMKSQKAVSNRQG